MVKRATASDCRPAWLVAVTTASYELPSVRLPSTSDGRSHSDALAGSPLTFHIVSVPPANAARSAILYSRMPLHGSEKPVQLRLACDALLRPTYASFSPEESCSIALPRTGGSQQSLVALEAIVRCRPAQLVARMVT